MIKYLAGTVVLSLGVLGFTAPGPSGDRVLHLGDHTKAVERLQRRLQKLKFVPGLINGYYGTETQAAVWAFQRSQGLAAEDEVGRDDWQALARPRALPPLVSTGQARRVEIGLRRRLLTVYRDHRPVLISHVVTGDGEPFCQYGSSSPATTPAGDFRVVRRGGRLTADPLVSAHETFSFGREPGTGLGGGVPGGVKILAGETTVGLAGEPVWFGPPATPVPTAEPLPTTTSPASPARPLSGCVRVPAHVAERLYRLVKVGDPVHVRRNG